MEINDTQRDQSYATATEEQRYLYANPESGTRLWAIAEKYHLTEGSSYLTFVTIVGDVVLGLRNRTELPTVLSDNLNLSFEQAIKITGDLIDFIDHPNNTESSAEEINQVVENSTQEISDDLSSDIAETEATLKAIPHIRTMASDMSQSQANKESTFSSTQEAILKEGRTDSDKNTTQWGKVN